MSHLMLLSKVERAKELELMLRNPLVGDVNLLPANRLHIIRMLHNGVKVARGGWYIHTASECLQIVPVPREVPREVKGGSPDMPKLECSCGREGDVVFFEVGSAGSTPAMEVAPIEWTHEEAVAQRHSHHLSQRQGTAA